MPCPQRGQGPVGCPNRLRQLCLVLVFFIRLVLHVFADFLCVEPYGVNAVTSRPKMIAPIGIMFEVPKLVEHSDCCSPFECSNQIPRSIPWAAPWPAGGHGRSGCLIPQSPLQAADKRHGYTAQLPHLLYRSIFGNDTSGTQTMWYWQCQIACDNLRNRLMVCSFLQVVGTTWVRSKPFLFNWHSR